MIRDGQAVLLYLGEDRQLYIDNSPGKHICIFEGRYFAGPKKGIIVINSKPQQFDYGLVKAPPNTTVQGIPQKPKDE